MTDVKVYVGNAGPFLYSCIRYDKDEVNITLIVGLVIGLGVPLILLIMGAFVCICKQRRIQKQKDNNNKDLEMTRHPRRVEWLVLQ